MLFSTQFAQMRRWCRRDLVTFFKWILLSLLVGTIAGAVGAAFAHCLTWATAFREAHFEIIFLLPLAGLAIVGIYHLMDMDNDGGTEFILASIRDTRHLHFRMLPLIFLSTVLTHLTGGSADIFQLTGWSFIVNGRAEAPGGRGPPSRSAAVSATSWAVC